MRDTENNEFLKPIYDLYDAVLEKDKYRDVHYAVSDPSSNPFIEIFQKKDKCIVCYTNVEEKLDNIKFFISKVKNNPVTFDRIWDFCEFIRIVEKIFFYRNTPDNDIYVEMAWSGKSTNVRKMRINYEDSEIRFTLDHSILNNDILTINVVRHFGLEMNNEYKIVNGEIGKYDDSSDLYMINEINKMLRYYMVDAVKSIVNIICESIKGEVTL